MSNVNVLVLVKARDSFLKYGKKFEDIKKIILLLYSGYRQQYEGLAVRGICVNTMEVQKT